LFEFQELGFHIEAVLRLPIDGARLDLLFDEFIDECVEANGLQAGGGFGETISMYVTAAGVRGSATEAHRAIVATWLQNHADVEGVSIDDLTDAWYGHD
jgi:uncharacterized protein YggL (DUF469 family)